MSAVIAYCKHEVSVELRWCALRGRGGRRNCRSSRHMISAADIIWRECAFAKQCSLETADVAKTSLHCTLQHPCLVGADASVVFLLPVAPLPLLDRDALQAVGVRSA